jgi:hypothetical protein
MKRAMTAAVGTALAAGVVLAPSAAFASTHSISSDYCKQYVHHHKSTTCTEATKVVKKTSKPQTLATSVTRASTLPFTGTDIAGMATVGVIVVGAGAGLTVAGRRRRNA